MPTISNLPLLTQATGTVVFPVVDYGTDPDTTRKATFAQFKDYLETSVSVKSVAGKVGVVTLDYTNIGGLDSIAHIGLLTATNIVLGGVKLDRVTIKASSSGTINVQGLSNNGYVASFDTYGNLNLPNFGRIQANNGGPVLAGFGSGSSEVAWADNDNFYQNSTRRNSLQVGTDGITVQINSNNLTSASTWLFDNDGNLNLPSSGDIKRNGSSVLIINAATSSTAGVVKIGSGISVTEDGTISASAQYVLAPATTSTIGGVVVGQGLSVDSSGTISLNQITSGFLPSRLLYLNYGETADGVGTSTIASFNHLAGIGIDRGNNGDLNRGAFIIFDDGYEIENVDGNTGNGAFKFLIGKSTSSGILVDYIRPIGLDGINFLGPNNPLDVINVDGTTDYEQQVASWGPDAIPNRQYVDNAVATTATAISLGTVKIGNNITASGDGTISVAAPYTLTTATSSILGGVKIGNNITASGDGTISVAAPYTLTTATDSVLGGIKLGSGLAATSDGTVRVTVAGGGSALTVKDEGTNLTTATTSLNFVGSGVIATVSGNDVTVTISGGGGGGSFSGGAVPSATQFLDASIPTNSGTGAVSVVGGIGVGGDSFFGGAVSIKSAAPSVASTAGGALTVVGGVGIGGGLFVANAVTATNIKVTSASSSSVVLAGGINIAGSATVVGSVTAGGFITGGSGVPLIQSPSSIILDAQTEVNVIGSPLRLWSRTVAQLSTQTVAMAGSIAFCPNESGGATPVFYDGTYWRKFHDRGIIS
jgi:hypothetical protein